MTQNLLSILCRNVQIEKKEFGTRGILIRISPTDEPNRLFPIAKHEHVSGYVVDRDGVLNQKNIGGIVLDEDDQISILTFKRGW